jgi:hypothetical protein
MDCKELENKLLELEACVQQESEICKIGILLLLIFASAALAVACICSQERNERLDRLERIEGIDAIGRRVK